MNEDEVIEIFCDEQLEEEQEENRFPFAIFPPNDFPGFMPECPEDFKISTK